MKEAFIILLATLLFALIVPIAGAQYGPYEEPPESLSILVDKTVARPYTEEGVVKYEYVDNIPSDTHNFRSGNFVFFRVRVKNTSDTTLYGVVVKDYLPDYVEGFENPGYFSENDRTLTIDVGDLSAGEEKTYSVKMRVLPTDQLFEAGQIVCVSNKSGAYQDDVSDEDTSQFCIIREGEGKEELITTTTIPKTGPEYAALILALSSVAGYAGLKLRKAK